MTPIDIVVVSYNRRDLLLQCCAAVGRLEQATRLFVVDNASDDGSAAAVRERVPAAHVIDMGSNRGFAAAVNRGVGEGSAPLVLLLNSDASIQSAALGRLAEVLERDPEVAGAGPRIRGAGGQLELSTGRTMSVLNDIGFLVAGLLHRGGNGPLTPLLERHASRPRIAGSLTGACLLLRRTALESVGGLDERFFLYAEDVDLCLRLRQAGWRLRYVPEATACHLRGGSAATAPAATALAYRRSQLAFYDKHRGSVQRTMLRGWLLARFGVAALLAGGARGTRARQVVAMALGRGAGAGS